MSQPVIIIQARMGSARLRGKVLLPLCGHSMLWHVVQRCRAAQGNIQAVVATTDAVADRPIRQMCTDTRIPYYAGSELDVLDRYYQCALLYQADPVIRVTADCPCVDPGLVRDVLEFHQLKRYDLTGAATGAGALYAEGCHFPDGLDVECYTFATLERLWLQRMSGPPSDREHVSGAVWRHPDVFQVGRVFALADYGHHRWTVDHPADYAMIHAIYQALWEPMRYFTMHDVLAYLEQHPEIYALNRKHVGHEGYAQLWKETE